MEFYKHVQYGFCCYVIKSAGEAANKVLLSVVWNPLLIEINLSQIRTLDIKREKVCAVCPYLLFSLAFSRPVILLISHTLYLRILNIHFCPNNSVSKFFPTLNVLLTFLKNSISIDINFDVKSQLDNFWEKNLCHSRDWNHRSPAFRTGALTN